jgi:2'-5' RNA ligase
MRCFIAIDLPDEIKSRIFHEFEKLPKSLFKGKITKKENLHLTLKFLGDITKDEVEKIKSRLKETKLEKFNCKIGKTGFFDENHARILWVELESNSNQLHNLQKLIEEKLPEFRVDNKEFNSHITTARIKSTTNKEMFLKEIKKIHFKDLEFEITNFYLMKSELKREGANYKVIEKYSLV